ncbi:MAG: dihydroorotase [Bryobacteraceae bacterium]|nr:dihydroorotase [Bryobacteraceae bacterium]
MSRLLIRGGRILDPSQDLDTQADLLIEEGRVAAIGSGLSAAGAEVFDAAGAIVAPGFYDIHVHFREPGYEKSETIESGARCAAAGGFTTVCCMPNTSPVNDSPELTRYIVQQARKVSLIRVHPIGAISKGSAGEELAQIEAMREAGAVAISDDGRPVMNSQVMRDAMEMAAKLGIPVIDHCEDLNLTTAATLHEGEMSSKLRLKGMPAAAEDIMVARDLILAELTGVRYHVAHISTRYSIAMVAHARHLGLPVTCEITPHHFTIADLDLIPGDGNYKMKPPLRACCDIDASLEGIMSGVIDAIATDHAPHSEELKTLGFERCPFGILGLETALGLSLERLVHPGRITLRHLVELFTTGPERVMRLGRGTLAPGSAGDVTIFDLNREWTYRNVESYSKSRNSPFDGRAFRGGPVATIVAGRVVWAHGEFQ